VGRFRRLAVLNAMIESGLVPVFYESEFHTAKEVIQACADGGARVVEYANQGDQAFQVFAKLVDYFATHRPEVILGVGTILDPGTAALYMSCGANFVVGPVLNPDVAKVCNRRKICYIPGCGTASEISAAEELGVEICKLFPGAQVGGPSFVRILRVPCPWSSIMPAGGVDATRESIREWFNAGVACVGMGSQILPKTVIASGDYEEISQKVAQVLAWIQQIRELESSAR